MLENSITTTSSNQVYLLDYYVHAENVNTTKTTVLNYLQLHLPLLDEQQIIDWLIPLKLTIDDQKAGENTTLIAGQTISITLPQHFEQQVALDWQTVWENDEILAVYKPAPLAVSRTTRNLYDTLIGLIRRQTPYYSAQLLHRLDIETSGLILIAKNKASDVKHKKNLKQLIELKTYHAIVKGIPQWSEFTAENELAERVDSDIRCKMYVVDPAQDRALYKKPKQSKTHFKVLKTQGDYSLIECQLFTGRKHQIRAQLAHLSLPIVGDKIYSYNGDFFLKRLAFDAGLTDADYQILGAKNHLLRAVTLGIRLDSSSPLVILQCDSFADDILDELHPKDTGVRLKNVNPVSY